MEDGSDENSPPAKRRFVVPVLSQQNAIGTAQGKRGTLLFGRASAAASTCDTSTSSSVGTGAHGRAHLAAPAASAVQGRPTPSTSATSVSAIGTSKVSSPGITTQVTLVTSSDDDADNDEEEVLSGTSPKPANSARAAAVSKASGADNPATAAIPRVASASSTSAVAGTKSATTTVTSSASLEGAAKATVSSETQQGKERAVPAAPAVVNKTKSSLSILVNPVQKGNPILPLIRNVPHEFDDSIIPDYVIGERACALFLSLRYHLLHPEYIYDRLKSLGRRYDLRVILVHVDVKDSQSCLQQLTSISILAECTLILAWSYAEAARYLETYKAYEKKPADLLKERVAGDYASKLTDCLTTLRFINKANVSTLSSSFGSLEKVIHASPQALALCPGFGANKANRLHKFFRQPFMTGRGRGRYSAAAASRGAGRQSAHGCGGASRPSASASATTGGAVTGGMDDDYDDDDNGELAPELEALLDVVDVYDELDGLDDDDDTWGA
eukprot:scpid65184/ scgid0036/ DNA excision repair protein ERCC-1